jgi:hypothetical protein
MPRTSISSDDENSLPRPGLAEPESGGSTLLFAMVTGVLAVVLAIALESGRQPTWAAVAALVMIMSLVLAGIMTLAMSMLADTVDQDTALKSTPRDEHDRPILNVRPATRSPAFRKELGFRQAR